MSFLDLGYGDRFSGEHKTVFRNGDELIYTANPKDPMSVIGDEEWYDEAALQVEVWEHNIDRLQEAGLPLTFNQHNSEMMFYEVSDDRIDGKLAAPAVRIQDYQWVKPYESSKAFDDITDEEEEQIRWMQETLDELIEKAEIAVQERELAKNDYRGPSCLRQWGRTEDGEVYLLEFGEYHHQLEGPYDGPEFLEEHGMEKKKHGVRSPIMLGEIPGFSINKE